MRRIGLLGGTFSPPHIGHLHAARAAHDALALDAVWLLPDAAPPHKELPPGTPSAQDRLAMVRLAVEGLPFADVCDIELQMPAPSYTVRTVEVLAERFPHDVFFFIVGSDMLLTLQNWVDPAGIFRHVRVAALSRAEADTTRLLAHAQRLRMEFGAKIVFVPADVLPISSTALREVLRREEEPPEIPDSVLSYIRARGLFR